MMPYRVQLKQDIYMPLDGQWQMVLSGSVVDVPDSMRFADSQITRLGGESPNSINANVKAQSVRAVRKPRG